MDLLTPELRERLIANSAAHHAAMQHDEREPDPAPVVKFFNPCGAARWLFSELDSGGDTLFGLCDLGFGCPELGVASLAEIASVRVGPGLTIERDLHFAASHPLTVYAEAARAAGGIVENDASLCAAAERLTQRRTPLRSSPPDEPKAAHGAFLPSAVPPAPPPPPPTMPPRIVWWGGATPKTRTTAKEYVSCKSTIFRWAGFRCPRPT